MSGTCSTQAGGGGGPLSKTPRTWLANLAKFSARLVPRMDRGTRRPKASTRVISAAASDVRPFSFTSSQRKAGQVEIDKIVAHKRAGRNGRKTTMQPSPINRRMETPTSCSMRRIAVVILHVSPGWVTASADLVR